MRVLHTSLKKGLAAAAGLMAATLIVACSSTGYAHKYAEATNAYEANVTFVRGQFDGHNQWLDDTQRTYEANDQVYVNNTGEVSAALPSLGAPVHIREAMKNSRDKWLVLSRVVKKDYLPYRSKAERKGLEAGVLAEMEVIRKDHRKVLDWLSGTGK